MHRLRLRMATLLALLSVIAGTLVGCTTEARNDTPAPSQSSAGVNGKPSQDGASSVAADVQPQANVVEIDGTVWTCTELLGMPEPCYPELEQEFAQSKARIDTYVNAGQLGPLNSSEFSYKDVAWIGLIACWYQDHDPNYDSFAEFVLATGTVKATIAKLGITNGPAALAPAWNEAGRFLCGEDVGSNASHATIREEIPGVSRSPGIRTP